MKRYVLLIFVGALLASCEKEITIDYRSMDKLYVVEGKLSDVATEVLITRTRDMSDSIKGKCVEGATVRIVGNNGSSHHLRYDNNRYRPIDSSFVGENGVSYTLEVAIDQSRFSSTSTKHATATIDSVRFYWQRLIGTKKMLVYSIAIKDIPQQENYYHYNFYINDKKYRWNILKDKANDGKTIMIDILVANEEYELLGDDYKDRYLKEGDRLFFEIQTIDKGVYDYLYSLSLGDRTSSNPIDNFTGGCLGYFSAYSSATVERLFHISDIPR